MIQRSPQEWEAWLDERLSVDDRVKDKRIRAYVKATAKHETAGTFDPWTKERYNSPTAEQRAKYPAGTNDRYIYFEEKYGHLTRIGKRLGNTLVGDGVRFAGRGLVQITGRRNYARFSELLGVNLVVLPDLVHEPENAYNIMVIGMTEGEFTQRRLTEFIYADHCDWANARRTVNGTDQAAHIAALAKRELARLAA